MRPAVFALGAVLAGGVVVGAGVSACNAVLGIDAAALESDSGSDSRSDAGSDAGHVAPPPADDGGDPLTCENYCKVIAMNCGAAPGSAEYIEYLAPGAGPKGSTDPCLFLCKYLIRNKGTYIPPSGPEPAPADTLACRLWHAYAAGSTKRPDVHCRHAGPLGSELCGDPCNAFCELDFDYCVDDNSVPTYSSQARCQSACGPDAGPTGFAYSVNSGDLVNDAGMITGGNTLNCRLWHLETAIQEDDPTTHCPHTSQVSSPDTCGAPVPGDD